MYVTHTSVHRREMPHIIVCSVLWHLFSSMLRLSLVFTQYYNTYTAYVTLITSFYTLYHTQPKSADARHPHCATAEAWMTTPLLAHLPVEQWSCMCPTGTAQPVVGQRECCWSRDTDASFSEAGNQAGAVLQTGLIEKFLVAVTKNTFSIEDEERYIVRGICIVVSMRADKD